MCQSNPCGVPTGSLSDVQSSRLGFRARTRGERLIAVVVYRVFLRVPTEGTRTQMEKHMSGYIAQRRGRFYVVIYEGTNPVTGKFE